MKRNALLYAGLIVVILVALLHFSALNLYLYWTISWFDLLVHFLAGVSVGLVSLWFLTESGLFKMPLSLQKLVFYSLVAIIIIGLAWEIFEFINGITSPGHESYIQDTFLDLVYAIIGTLLAVTLGVRKQI